MHVRLAALLAWACLASTSEGFRPMLQTRPQMRLQAEEDQGIPVRSLVISSLIIFGFFGTSLTGVTDIVQQVLPPPPGTTTEKPQLKNNGERGAMTRLSRKEINEKLAQVPVFFVDDGGKILVDGSINVGKIFFSIEDAEAYAKAQKGGLKVGATTLEDVYYPLYVNRAKILGVLPDVVKNSDASASYELVPSSKQLKVVSDGNYDVPDVPLYRIANLAFKKEKIEVPLFLVKDDALQTYARLKEGAQAALENPTVQVTSISKIVKLWEEGGVEGRALELYPAIEDIEAARKLIGAE